MARAAVSAENSPNAKHTSITPPSEIYELQKINSLIKSISIINDYKLKKIKLYKNLYEISYFGNYDILKKLLSMETIDINLINDECEINFK